MLQFGPDGYLYASRRRRRPRRAEPSGSVRPAARRAPRQHHPHRPARRRSVRGARRQPVRRRPRRPTRDLGLRASQPVALLDRSRDGRPVSCPTSGARHARRSTSSLAADAGRNFGWPCFEGTVVFDDTATCDGPVAPLLEYPRADGACAIIGGVVVRDPRLAALSGRYLYGDLCTGVDHGDRSRRRPCHRLRRARPRRPRALELRRRRTRARLRHVPPRRRLPARSAARALNSATQAAPRSPSQIGVSST